MTQLDLFLPQRVDLDGKIDPSGCVTYFGIFQFAEPAQGYPNAGFYRGLADCTGSLAIVEVKLTFPETARA